MSPELQRIAIAEACGWKRDEPCQDFWVHENYPYSLPTGKLPDYLNDLNAMHEAEKTLTSGVRNGEYKTNLLDVTFFGDPNTRQGMFLATAAQRAEAFLKTINRWSGQ